MKSIKDMLKEAKPGITVAPHNEIDLYTAGIDFPSHSHAICIYEKTQKLAEEIRDIIITALHNYDSEVWRAEKLLENEITFIPNKIKKTPTPITPHTHIPPHAKERALYWSQRAAGTNEVWQVLSGRNIIDDIPVNTEPNWVPGFKYRPKPKPTKLTAKIVRETKLGNKIIESQDWEFTGTIEEYREECKKYGYYILTPITEVKV